MLEKGGLLEVVRAVSKNAPQLDLNLRAVEAGFQCAGAREEEECLWAV